MTTEARPASESVLPSDSKLRNDRRVPLSSPRPTSRVVLAPAPSTRYANVTSAIIRVRSLSHLGLRNTLCPKWNEPLCLPLQTAGAAEWLKEEIGRAFGVVNLTSTPSDASDRPRAAPPHLFGTRLSFCNSLQPILSRLL